MAEQEGITVKKAENFSEWYTQVVQKAELADIRYNVKGFVVFMPWSVQTMNRMFELFEKELQRTGHVPALFPAVIPESNFKLESEHVKGFLPEVFWVTEAGSRGENVEERLALRPTSETAIYKMYSIWVRSWRDLPLKIYQRCQVWRYETKATRPFIRSREFHWIETHDVFANQKEAEDQVKEDMKTTEKVIHGNFAVPFLFFQRPEHDKFPGAVHTYAADTLMPDGKVLQLPSTHLLGQNFSKPFNIKFVDKDKSDKFAYQTCYGPSVSRIIAAVISLHGDDKGLVLPPDISPVQVIIVPIYFSEKEKKAILGEIEVMQKKFEAEGILVKVDTREEYTPGWKFNFWEMKGVPLRIEIGPKDIAKKQVVAARRDTGKKETVKQGSIVNSVKKILEDIQKNLRDKADNAFEENMHETNELGELKGMLEDEGGLVKINWCGEEACAEAIRTQTNGGVIRGTLFGKKEKITGNCINCKKTAKEVVYVAKQY